MNLLILLAYSRICLYGILSMLLLGTRHLLSIVDGCESGNEDNNVRDSDNAVKFCEKSFDNSAFSNCNR